MGRYQPAPSELFEDGRRHLFAFAHQDDDLPYSGLLQRTRANARVVWMTNGDGLAPAVNMDLEEYARMRTGEARAAMRILGYERGQLHFLGHSELFFYPLFIELKNARDDDSVPGSIRDKALGAARSIEGALRPLIEEADVVWTLAWQGGHPEHDLAHLFTVRSVRAVEEATGRTIPIYELPAYELTVAVPLRFAPWHREERFRITLTNDELARKEAAFSAYRSQAELTALFKRLISIYGLASTLCLRPFTFRSYARHEEFAPVPVDRDYTRSTHAILPDDMGRGVRRTLAHTRERLHARLPSVLANRLPATDFEPFDYMFEDYEGDLVSFRRSIARYVKLLPPVPGRPAR